MQKKFIILLVILIFFLLAGGIFWWWQSQPKDQVPKGVTVSKKEGEKIIENRIEGYKIKIPKNFITKSKNTDKIELLSPESISAQKERYYYPELLINTIDNPQKLSLEAWLQKQHEAVGFIYWNQREKVKINDIAGYKIKTEGPIEQYHYFLQKNNKIYVITIPSDSKYPYIVENFKLE